MSHLSKPGCFPSSAIWGGPYNVPSTLPLGEWHVMANGRIHFLQITSVSGSEVTGDYNGEALVHGSWDSTTRMLKFYRFIPDVGGGRSLLQHFTGYLMHFAEPDGKWRIAGIFAGNVHKPPSDPDSPKAGWYATLNKEDIEKKSK